jgi:predicted nucleotidyltransferase
MINKLGFKQDDLSTIVQIISTIPEIKKVVIFGSRAKGDYKAGSDTDMAVWSVNDDAVLRLSGILNDETLLPYKFDVLNYNTINSKELKEHIDRVGVEIYKHQ